MPTQAQKGACRLESLGEAVVASVSDGRTLVLADGRTVRLTGMGAPMAVEPGRADPAEAAPPADLMTEAKSALARLTLDKSVVLKGTGPGVDRHGRIPAHV